MKAMVLEKVGNAADAFQLKDVPDPVLESGEILVDVEASGLNFADVMARRGLYQDAPPLPAVMGYEVVGRVSQVSTGPGTDEFKVGDRVCVFTRFGGYAEKVKAIPTAIQKIDDTVPAVEALALATQYCTAYFAAEEMGSIRPGSTVLINAAAGGVGIALIQLAKLKKCTIFGLVSSDAKVEFLKKLGVQYPIQMTRQNFVEEVRKVVGNRGIDVAFDSVGGQNFKKCFQLLGTGGRLVGYGAASMLEKKGILGKIQTGLGFGLYSPIQLLMKTQGILGVNMLTVADERPDLLKRCMTEVYALYESGKIKPHVHAEYSIHDLAKAHDALENRGTIGKIGVRWK